MFWKIYFWVFIIILALAYISEGIGGFWGFADLLISSGALAGLFLYGYKKRLFNTIFWKVFFLFYVVWDFSYNLIIEPQSRGGDFHVIALLGFLFVVPIYIALYLYAFRFMNED
jgi:hypothetical protein